MTTSAAPRFKKALKAAAEGLWNDPNPTVLVTFGNPAFDTFNDCVAFGAVTSESEPGPLGPRRQREETLTQEVHVWAFVPGGQEAEVAALDRGYELLADLEEYVRVTDTTLAAAVGASDVVRHCFLAEHVSDEATDQSVLSKGRMCVITATFAAVYRITS